MGKSSSNTNSSFNQDQNTTENLATHQTDLSQQYGTQSQTGTGTANQFGTGSVTGSQGPWGQAQPALQSLLSGIQSQTGNLGLTGNQQSAINQMLSNAGNLPNYTGQATNLANGFLSGDPTGLLKTALSSYQSQLNPIANAELDPTKTPGISNYLNTIQSDITNNIRGQFAGAGRDFS